MSRRDNPYDPATWSPEGRAQMAEVLRRALSRDGLRTTLREKDMTLRRDGKRDRAVMRVLAMRDEAQGLAAENAVLRGDVVTTDVELELDPPYEGGAPNLRRIRELQREGRAYKGKALDGQRVSRECYGHPPDPERDPQGLAVYCDGSCAHPLKGGRR